MDPEKKKSWVMYAVIVAVLLFGQNAIEPILRVVAILTADHNPAI